MLLGSIDILMSQNICYKINITGFLVQGSTIGAAKLMRGDLFCSCDLPGIFFNQILDSLNTDPAAFLKKEIGGAHGALVTAVSPKAFAQATGMLRRGGTMSLVGLPPGDFPLDIFGMVLNGITVRGSIVGSRLDLQESLAFAEQAKVAATVASDRLENINDIFARMHAGQIEGRIVLDMNA